MPPPLRRYGQCPAGDGRGDALVASHVGGARPSPAVGKPRDCPATSVVLDVVFHTAHSASSSSRRIGSGQDQAPWRRTRCGCVDSHHENDRSSRAVAVAVQRLWAAACEAYTARMPVARPSAIGHIHSAAVAHASWSVARGSAHMQARRWTLLSLAVSARKLRY